MLSEGTRTRPALLRYEISYADRCVYDLCVNLGYALEDGDAKDAAFCRSEILKHKSIIAECRATLDALKFAQYPIFEEV